jgi:hypothetical protein
VSERPEARDRLAELAPLGGLTASFVLVALLVDPRGDFPLNDDWGYGPAVRTLVEEGRLQFTNWPSMPLLTHVLWGALFCLPSGFSYTALRLSTLTAAWLGVLATYALLRQLGASRGAAFVGGMALALNPLYVGLAHSFMTDAPFVAALVAATAAWIRATLRDSWGLRVLAVVLALWATLDRQLGVALPMAWTIVEALRLGLGVRWITRALLPALVVIGGLVAYEKILGATIGLPALYHEKTRELGEAIFALVRLRGLRLPAERTVLVLAYLGLFAGPLLLLAGRRLATSGLARWAPLGGALVGAAAALAGRAMPLTGNVWIDFGIGPRTAPGVIETAPAALWTMITAASGAGAVALVVAIGRGALRSGIVERTPWRALPRRVWQGLRGRAPSEAGDAAPSWVWVLLVLVPAIGFVPTSIAYGAFFDRYVLAHVPFALALVVLAIRGATAERPHRAAVSLAAVALALMLAFSVPATHDYLAWQRARWQAVDRLAQRGVPREAIHGGFEVDNADPGPDHVLVNREKAPWSIALSELGGYATVESLPVRSWLPWSVRAVHVMERRKD